MKFKNYFMFQYFKGTSLFLLFICVLMLPIFAMPVFADDDYYDDDTDSDYSAEDEAGSEYLADVWDPFEGMNREILVFNDWIWDRALKIADFYVDYVPQKIRFSLKNSIRNVTEPYYAFNNLIEGDIDGVMASIARIVINSSAGFLGTIDVAGENCLPYTPQNLSTTLGAYGVPIGPYLMVPLLGPGSIRSVVSLAAESFADPIPYALSDAFHNLRQRYKNIINISYQTVRVIDNLDSSAGAIRIARENSFDFYVFSRSAYYQLEGSKIAGAKYKGLWDSAACNDSARRSRKDDF